MRYLFLLLLSRLYIIYYIYHMHFNVYLLQNNMFVMRKFLYVMPLHKDLLVCGLGCCLFRMVDTYDLLLICSVAEG